MHCLIAAAPLLAGGIEARAIAPQQLFFILRAVAGQLATVGYPVEAPELPAYDHDEIFSCFAGTLDFIERRIAAVRQPFEAVAFEPTQGGFRLGVSPIAREGKLMVALLSARDQKPEDCADWFMASVIGSDHEVEGLHLRRMLGAARAPARQERLSELERRNDGLVFEIDLKGPYATLGPGLTVFNRTGLGSKPLEIHMIAPVGGDA